MKSENRELIIQAAVDLFGYSESDFDDVSFADIYDYLLDSQITKIETYLGRRLVN